MPIVTTDIKVTSLTPSYDEAGDIDGLSVTYKLVVSHNGEPTNESSHNVAVWEGLTPQAKTKVCDIFDAAKNLLE